MRRAIVALLALLVLTSESEAASQRCFRKSEAVADQAIRYQTEVMVISDTCRNEIYRNFSNRNRDALVSYQHELISYFRRSEGGHAESRLDSFMTRLANETALRTGAQNVAAVCSLGAEFLATADRLAGEEFRRLMEKQTAEKKADYHLCKE